MRARGWWGGVWRAGPLGGWGVCGAYAAPDVDEAGLPVGGDGGDNDPGEPFFDEAPAEDWTASLGALGGWQLAEPWARRVQRVKRT